ncbi:hypothetical protein H4J38_09535 [Colwellia sp. BRX10-3]|uniref:hypothetical protein n=1 Tax=Colwellia sp. BRX10-3 TaxID=2759844 RepID=UPI0015F590A4|nr:hypothetical protein [Colwellia sp. BRX10-3]MBA6391015.1 hypothetical protein [Colwellia sp. BRX10-3]
MRSIYCLFIILLTLSACSGDSTEKNKPDDDPENLVPPSANLAIPDNRFTNNYQVVIFGNSHVAGLDSLIKTLISAGNPFAKINISNAGGGFLDDQFNRQRRVTLLENRPWTHVILQGQKYSQSGATIYPTIAARVWIDKAKNRGITPILFPEHPQKDNNEEGKRVHKIHTGIAAIQKSCVAPVGLTWDKVIITEPELALHSSDGNHASVIGKLLTAFVFYEVITGESADLLPFIDGIGVDQASQQILRQFASETIQAFQPCMFDT